MNQGCLFWFLFGGSPPTQGADNRDPYSIHLNLATCFLMGSNFISVLKKQHVTRMVATCSMNQGRNLPRPKTDKTPLPLAATSGAQRRRRLRQLGHGSAALLQQLPRGVGGAEAPQLHLDPPQSSLGARKARNFGSRIVGLRILSGEHRST